MKFLRICAAFIIVFISIAVTSNAYSQCSMCTLNAENSVQNGNVEGKGLNDGILYLLAAPYLAVAAVGFLWYKKYRRKNAILDMKDEKIHLN